MKLPRNLLDRPAEEMARLVALAFLDQANTARRHFEKGEPEGLHDFRVGVRRLRTALRAFRPELRGGVSGRSRRRLKRLARATAESRDLEVHAAWVASYAGTVTARQRPGIDWMLERVARARKKADRRLKRILRRTFPGVRRRLKEELGRYRLTVRLDRTPAGRSAARAVGCQVQRIAGDLEARLHAIHSVHQADAAHAARIRVKRLRYILEPLHGRMEVVTLLGSALRDLQDTLGDLQDAEVYGRQLREARREARREQVRLLRGIAGRPHPAKEYHDPRPGLVELSRRLMERKAAAFATLEATWLKGRSEDFFNQLNELARILIHGDEAPAEIERKFLLRQMPPAARTLPALDIELGWLPGVRISEKVRKVTASGQEHRFRTINAGVGSGRLEVEEEVAAPVLRHPGSDRRGGVLQPQAGPIASRRSQRFRVRSPSFSIRLRSVLGLMPSSWAAPRAPWITPPVASSACWMWERSASSSRARRTGGRSARAVSSSSPMWTTGPRASTQARSITFCSSRMFPGQA
jgi:CHAD domain-containing protein